MATRSTRKRVNQSEGNEDREGIFKKITNGMTSLAGFMTALATLMTAVTGLLGTVVKHQSDKIDQQSRQINHLQQQVTATATPNPASATSSTAPPTSTAQPARFLNELEPTDDKIGGRDTAGTTMSNVAYPHSLSITCEGARIYQAYNVAGSRTISATAGIADNASNATGVVADVILSDQAGNPVGAPITVSLGHPKQINLPLQGVAQLEIACNGRDQTTGRPRYGFFVTLGDAKLQP
jgi:hypothetical protein